MVERRTRGGYESGSMTASEMLENFPESFKRPATEPAPEPQDAPPRVPNLPCPKCGNADTTMRFCSGGYSLTWGMCADHAPAGHFHRDCPRCTHRWTTYDVLDAQ